MEVNLQKSEQKNSDSTKQIRLEKERERYDRGGGEEWDGIEGSNGGEDGNELETGDN